MKKDQILLSVQVTVDDYCLTFCDGDDPLEIKEVMVRLWPVLEADGYSTIEADVKRFRKYGNYPPECVEKVIGEYATEKAARVLADLLMMDLHEAQAAPDTLLQAWLDGIRKGK